MRVRQIQEALEKRNIKTTRQTIARYELQMLIPEADRNNRGEPGRVAEYPEQTVHEFYASHRLLSGNFGDRGLKDVLKKGAFQLVLPKGEYGFAAVKTVHSKSADTFFMRVPPQLVAAARQGVLAREWIFARDISEGKKPADIWEIKFEKSSDGLDRLIYFLEYEWAYEREISKCCFN